MTVRQALTDLINENIIYSVPKVGSFVCKKSRFKSFDGLNSVTEDCAKKKEDCTSHVVLNELEEATDLMKKEMALLVYIKQRYPIDNQNIYWSLLMMISLSTLCIYHILYYDFLEILGVNRHLIILTTLVITMMISYYMFFKYTKLNHEQQLLNQAITYFKNDQQNYAYLEKKNNELYKLKHDLKYDYLQMKQAIKEKEFETINQIVDQKIALLDQEDMLITSGNKLLDSFINMKLEQLQLKKIIPTMIISIQDISFIQDDHLNIIINYLFDLTALCVNHQELQVKIIQDTCVFEITMTMHLGIENIDPVKYDTLKLLLKKYQGSIKIIHENQNLIISLLIPMQ